MKILLGAIVLLATLLVIAAVLLVPFTAIWSLNTLFPALAIAYNGYTWLAMYVLIVLFGYRSSNFKLNKNKFDLAKERK